MGNVLGLSSKNSLFREYFLLKYLGNLFDSWRKILAPSGERKDLWADTSWLNKKVKPQISCQIKLGCKRNCCCCSSLALPDLERAGDIFFFFPMQHAVRNIKAVLEKRCNLISHIFSSSLGLISHRLLRWYDYLPWTVSIATKAAWKEVLNRPSALHYLSGGWLRMDHHFF